MRFVIARTGAKVGVDIKIEIQKTAKVRVEAKMLLFLVETSLVSLSLLIEGRL